MTGSRPGNASVRAATVVYALLLMAYPRDFRLAFSDQMVQVFRTACLQSMRSDGASGLLQFWLRALSDLVISASSERVSAMRRRKGLPQQYVYLGALIVGVITGYIHLRTDADRSVILLLLAGAFLCGAVRPAAAWRCALITGLGIPGVLLIAHGSSAGVMPHHDTDLPILTPLLPAMVAAYCGAIVPRLLPWVRLTFKIARERPSA